MKSCTTCKVELKSMDIMGMDVVNDTYCVKCLSDDMHKVVPMIEGHKVLYAIVPPYEEYADHFTIH